MRKTDLANAILGQGLNSLAHAERVVSAVFEAVTSFLAKGEEVRVSGFGVFRVRETKERQGKNPQTGEVLTIPAGKKPAFRAASALKEAIR